MDDTERQAIIARLQQYVEDVDRLYSNIAQIERAWAADRADDATGNTPSHDAHVRDYARGHDSAGGE